MITFILLFAGLVVVIAGWLIAQGAGKRKRSRQADEVHVMAEQTGEGAPKVQRATGID